MSGLTRLPDLSTDPNTNLVSTSPNATSTHDDGGTFDQLVAKVSNAPEHGSPAGPATREDDAHTRGRAPKTPDASADNEATSGSALVVGADQSSLAETAVTTDHLVTPERDAGAKALGSSSLVTTRHDSIATREESKSAVSVTDAVGDKVRHSENSDPAKVGSNADGDAKDASLGRAAAEDLPSTTHSRHDGETTTSAGPTTGDQGTHRPTNPDQPSPMTTDTTGVREAHSDTSNETLQVAGAAHTAASSPINSPSVDARQNTAHGGELPGVASQLLNVISPLRQTPAGNQTLTIALHPEGLGEVRVALTVTDGQTTVRLIASSAEGANAIPRNSRFA